MLGIIADHIMSRRHRLGRHVLFIGSEVRIPPSDLPMCQILQELAREQVGESFQHLPMERRGPAALAEFARQVPADDRRCQLLRARLADARPSEGHIQLAHLVQDGYFPTIFTMEPHNLLEQALSTQHLEPEADYHLLVAGVDDPEIMSVALEGSSRVVVVKCGGDLARKYLPLTPEEIGAGLEPTRALLNQAFRVLSIFTAYSDRDEPFLDFMPAEGGKIFWVNPQVPVADAKMYTELKLESPGSVAYHRLQPKVINWLKQRQSQRHLLVREAGSFNDFFARLHDRFQYRHHASRRQTKDLSVLRGGPYRFLDYFDTEDSELFFGREREIQDLIDLIARQPMTVLFGRSGIGKSSLIKAGVMARMQGRDEEHLDEAGTWLAVYARCEDDPVASIREAALRAAEEEGCELGEISRDASLCDLLTHVAATSHKRVVVFLDEAEELFVKLGGRVRDTFVQQVKEALAAQDDELRVLLSIREDYVGELYELRDDLPEVMQNVYRLHKLDRTQAEKAIVQPAVNFGLQVERKLVDQLLEDLTREGIEPAQLQIVCHRLYEEMPADAEVITQRNYEKLGRAATILRDYLHDALRQLPMLERGIARTILKRMAVSSELKATRSLERIAQEVGQDRRTVERVLAKMVDFRLVRGLSKDKQRNYELVHEQLAEQVDDWVSEEALKLRDVQDLLTRELNNFQKFGLLMGNEELHIIDDHREELSISPEEMELIIRSAAANDTETEYWFCRADELEAAMSPILTSLLTDESPQIRRVTYRNLADLLHEDLIPALVAGLDDDQIEVRRLAADYLELMKRELTTWLRSGDRHQQLAAAQALGRISADDPRSASALIEVLSDDNPQLTEHITQALKRVDNPRNTTMLINRITSQADAPWAAGDVLGHLSPADTQFGQLGQALRNHPRLAQLHYAQALAQILRREFDQARESLNQASALSATPTAEQYINRALDTIEAEQQQATPGNQWPMFGGSAQHGAFAEQTLAPPLRELWSVRTGAPVVASPVVSDHIVYIGSRDGVFYALDSQEGHIRWTREGREQIEAAAVVVEDLVIFGTLAGRLHALHRSTGQQQWQHELGAGVRSAGTVHGSQLFVGDESGSLWAIDWSRGDVNWELPTEQQIVASAAVSGDLVVVGSWDNGLYAAHTADGQVRWRLDTNGSISSAPAISGSTVFCGSDDSSMYAVDLAGGQIKWQAELGGMVRSAPAIAGDRLVVGCADGKVYCLDTANGKQIWQYQTGEEVLASAVITGDIVYIGSKDGVLYALDLADGQVKWEHRTVYGVYSTPAVAEATLYIGIAYYYVSAFTPQ